tara:strand:- start:3193 stop:4929 length:1737 start_codon:yes stop_codon:yes gene_type:complete
MIRFQQFNILFITLNKLSLTKTKDHFYKIKKSIGAKSKKIFYKYFILKVYNFLIQRSLGNRNHYPSKFPFELYELIDNNNSDSKDYKQKIILPYKDLTIFTRNDINQPCEVLAANIIEPNNHKDININFKKTKFLILPIAILDKEGFKEASTYQLELFFNNKKLGIELKYLNRFHYLPIRTKNDIDKLKIISNIELPLAIGKPYASAQRKTKRPKLIIHMHIDALPQSIIDKYGLDIMPNTKRFFTERGTCFSNAYAQSEWTLPSVASTFTGAYTNKHLLYHPKKKKSLSIETIANTLQKNGYKTFACSSVQRINPGTSFDKGFDRFILAPFENQNYIINEALEQLNAFDCDQYIFLAFMDIHEAHRLQPISTQISSDINDFQFREEKSNRTMKNYDKERLGLLRNSLYNFDGKLEKLYKAINNFDKDAIVILHSDHGISFMSKTEELLSKEREKVIFLYKNNTPARNCSEIKELRDLPSMICNDLGIKSSFKHNNKPHVITESLYPNRNYEVAVRSNKCVLFFKITWDNLMKKSISEYSVSMHPSDNEEVELPLQHTEYESLLLAAKSHTLELFKNI